MGSIPDRFIREAKIDFDGEIFASMGVSLHTHGNELSPLTIGELSLLETMDNRLLKNDPAANMFDFAIIFYLNKYKEKAVADVAEYVRGYKAGLERKVKRFMMWKRLTGSKLSLYSMSKIEEWLQLAFTGFDMIPKSGGNKGGGSYLFGADTLAGLAWVSCQRLNTSFDRIWWKTPLTLLGHISAINAAENGVKGVGRSKDLEHMKAIFKKCRKWDSENRMYPWQWMQPEMYQLGPTQQSKELKLSHAKRLKEVS